jgi:hypothetical protein
MPRVHTHQPVKSASRQQCYDACARPSQCVPEAHGNIVRIDICACGAVRRLNVNGQHVESSGWRKP